MKTIAKLLIVLPAVAVLFTACQKEEIEPRGPKAESKHSVPSDSKTFTDHIIGENQKTWSLVNFTMGEDTSTPECKLDDLLSFYNGGKFINNLSNTNCEQDERPYLANGTYEVVPENKLIKFYQNGIAYDMEVVNLTRSSLLLKGEWDGLKVTANYYYDILIETPEGHQK